MITERRRSRRRNSDVCKIRKIVTVQQVCALAALTVRILRLEGKNPIGEVDLEWIFARNCEGTEPLLMGQN